MKKLNALFLIACLLLFATCKKNQEDPEPDQEPVTYKPLVYQDNAINVSATATSSTHEDIQNGTMVITDAALLADINPGSVLYSAEEDGYLVKVTSISGSTLTVEPAALDELFKDGEFVFTNENAGTPQKVAAYNFPLNVQLLNESGLTCDLSGSVNFDPTVTGYASFVPFLPKKFNLDIKDAPLDLNLEMHIQASPNGTLNIDKQVILGQLSVPATLYGVKMNFRVRLIDRIKVTGTADIDQTISYTQNNKLSASLKYDNGWTSSFNLVEVGENLDFDANFKTTLTIRHEVTAYCEVMLFGIVGPYVKIGPYNDYNFKGYADTDGDVLWNFNAIAGADGAWGFSSRIFKDLNSSNAFEVLAPIEFYSAPKKVEIVSGNNQPGTIGVQLPQPLTVKVRDSEDNELAGAMVHFEVTEGTGVLSEQKVFTNASGIASVNLTPSTGDEIVVKATIQVADGSGAEIASQEFNVNGLVQLLISGSPWTITANSEDGKNLFSYNNTDTIKCSSLPQDTMVYYEKEKMNTGSITFGQGSGSISKQFEKHDYNSGTCGQLVITNESKGESLSGWTLTGNQIVTSNAQYTVSISGGTLTLTGTKTVDEELIPVSITATKAP